MYIIQRGLVTEQLRRRYHLRAEFAGQIHLGGARLRRREIIVLFGRAPPGVEPRQVRPAAGLVLDQLLVRDRRLAELARDRQFGRRIASSARRLRCRTYAKQTENQDRRLIRVARRQGIDLKY